MFFGDNELSLYARILPKLHFPHKGSIIVLCTVEVLGKNECVVFVPVRHITKKPERNVCAYCDNAHSGNCHHTRTISAIMQTEKNYQDKCDGVEQCHTTDERLEESVSFLPLSPVNCEKAIAVDQTVRDLARASKPYILEAPARCYSCASIREESSRTSHAGGVLMCTIGRCKMIIEEYRCSSQACGSRKIPEGRENCILLENGCTTNGSSSIALSRQLNSSVTYFTQT